MDIGGTDLDTVIFLQQLSIAPLSIMLNNVCVHQNVYCSGKKRREVVRKGKRKSRYCKCQWAPYKFVKMLLNKNPFQLFYYRSKSTFLMQQYPKAVSLMHVYSESSPTEFGRTYSRLCEQVCKLNHCRRWEGMCCCNALDYK